MTKNDDDTAQYSRLLKCVWNGLKIFYVCLIAELWSKHRKTTKRRKSSCGRSNKNWADCVNPLNGRYINWLHWLFSAEISYSVTRHRSVCCDAIFWNSFSNLNPLKCSGVSSSKWSMPSRSNLHFLISDIWALWCSALSARVAYPSVRN